MEHIAPLIQTVLWVGLIVGVIWRFHSPIYGLLTALQKRIESGSSLKAGPFELSALETQPTERQRERVAAEVQEAIEDAVVVQDPDSVQVQNLHRAVQSRYLQSEDLVCRALQAEYGVPISRNLMTPGGREFDGVFVSNGRPTVVEIKYIRGHSPSVSRVKDGLLRARHAVNDIFSLPTRFIIAVVCDSEVAASKVRTELESAFSSSSGSTVVRTYVLDELRQKFGLDPEHERPGT